MSSVRCSARGGPAAFAKHLICSMTSSLPHRRTATQQAHTCIASLTPPVQHRWRQLHDLYDNRQTIGRDASGDRASILSRLRM
jgi:hypothetical protein